MINNIITEALNSVAFYLTKKQKRDAGLLFILLIISSILDVFGLASLVPIIMVASSPGGVSSNKYFSYLFEVLHFQNEQYFLISLISSVFLFFLFKHIFTTWINYKQAKFIAKIALHIVTTQFRKYTNLPFWEFNEIGSAAFINTVFHVPQYYVNFIIRSLFTFFSEFIIVVIVIIGIFLYEPLLLIILALVLVPSTVVTYRVLKKRSEKLGVRLNELRAPALETLSNTFNGFIELKLANKVKDFNNVFIKNQEETQALDAKAYLFSLIPLKIIEMVAILGVVTIFFYSILFPDSSGSLVTIIGLFAAAAYRLMPSVNRLLGSMVTMKQHQYSIRELSKFKEYIPDNHQFINTGQVLKFQEAIQFSNVSFSFPQSSSPVIQNIDLKIHKGEKVGFIGASGSGKTTLMNILLRFYNEHQGQILVDGIPLTEGNKLNWYNIVGYVKQDTFLMEASIKDNITLSSEEVDVQRLEYAIELSSLKDFVTSLPEGVNTFIGERGSKLSGGQKQRVGIARALYKNTQVLVLDEATSALDTNTEREVSEAIKRLAETDITIFIIAHRITTLKDCNRIFEMKYGRIVAEQSYQEVLNNVV